MEDKKDDLKLFKGNKTVKEMHLESIIDVAKDVSLPPVAVSIGETHYGQERVPNAFGTYGNFSVVAGTGKVRKSFFISLIVASYQGGRANEYAPNFLGHDVEGKNILHFDTEQGDWHAQNGARRVVQMVGSKHPKYFPKKLRRWTPRERVEYIEWCILHSHYSFKNQGGIGLVIIDGLADLVTDVNDIKECNAIVQKLMTWTEISNCHCVVVIHTNFGSDKLTGHLGSALIKKGETICILTADPKSMTTNVDFKYTRGAKLDTLTFEVNNNLPYITGTKY